MQSGICSLSRVGAGAALQEVGVSTEQPAMGDVVGVSDVVAAAEDAGLAGGLMLVDMQRDRFAGFGSAQGLVDRHLALPGAYPREAAYGAPVACPAVRVRAAAGVWGGTVVCAVGDPGPLRRAGGPTSGARRLGAPPAIAWQREVD